MSDGGPDDASSGASSGSSDDDSTDDAAMSPWSAYRFQETVEPRSGGSGKIQSYSYTSTEEDSGEKTVIDVDVEVLGIGTEDIRSQKMDLTGGEPVTVTFPVEVTKLRHTFTVVQDDTGELEAGRSGAATLWVPTDPAAPGTFLGYFAHLDFEEGDDVGVWEYHTPADDSGTFYLPFTEGEDPTSWWGYDLLLGTYGLNWWSGLFVEDSGLEEGTFGFGGYQYKAERDTLEVGRYAFDGWRVTWSVASAGDRGGYTVAVAPELPIPVAYDYGSTTGGESDRIAFELTDLELG